MTWFLRRPLTCLFWVAALCGGVAGLREQPSWWVALLYAVLYIVSAWAAVGGAHRLARGGILVTAPLALAAGVLFNSGRVDARDTLALAMLMTGIVFALTLGLSVFGRIVRRRDNPTGEPRWQISLTEILGWTIVAAIASWSASMAHIPDWENVYGLATTMLTPVPAAAMVAAFLGVQPRCDRAGLVAVIAVLGAFFLFAVKWDQQSGDNLAMYAFMFTVVGLWTLVVRLDENAAERAAISKWWPRRKNQPPS